MRILRNKIYWYHYISWMCACCSLAAVEFNAFNTLDFIPVWRFSLEHVLGIDIWNIAIEDWAFMYSMGTAFYLLFIFYDKKINHQSSELGKAITMSALIAVTVYFFLHGKLFAHYQCVRMVFGIVGISLTYKTWDLKHFWCVMGTGVFIAIVWELYSGNDTPQHWYYRDILDLTYANKLMMDKFWFKLGKAWFSLETIPFYPISGVMYLYGVLSVILYKFQYRKKYEYEKIRSV